MSGWSDSEILEALDLHERQGLSFDAVAQRMGRSRGAVAGIVGRVSGAADAEPDLAVKPANRDGGMPARWWATATLRRGGSSPRGHTGRGGACRDPRATAGGAR